MNLRTGTEEMAEAGSPEELDEIRIRFWEKGEYPDIKGYGWFKC